MKTCQVHNEKLYGYIIPDGYKCAGEFVEICYTCVYAKRIVLFEKHYSNNEWIDECMINFFLSDNFKHD